ncbi:MAG: adenosylcobinamide-GDP ribazoletransferase [Tissierellia bacterium]|nr:adenosylcobinamide-GDP ribazoletransferase [Tissierellia bacterium]
MINGLIVAFQFLSRIPIPIAVDFNKENLKSAVLFFPLVGLVLGGIVGITVSILGRFSIEIAALVGVIINIVLTGGLHIDGLSDMCDGFFSNKDREQIIEIMHDSRVGSFGVLSIVLLVLAKYVLYKSITVDTLAIIALSGMFSRMAVTSMILRKENVVSGGMGEMIKSGHSTNFVILGFIVYSVITILYNSLYILPLVVNLLFVEYLAHLSYKKIGGVSGDIYGATVELSEVFNLLCFWGIINWIL